MLLICVGLRDLGRGRTAPARRRYVAAIDDGGTARPQTPPNTNTGGTSYGCVRVVTKRSYASRTVSLPGTPLAQ